MKEKKQTAFSVFFSQFPRLLLLGAVFSIIATICMTLSLGIGVILSGATKLSGFNSVFIWALGLIPTSLFYSGMVKVIRKYAIEKEFVPVVPTFFKAVSDNAKGSLLIGVFAYLLVACSFYSTLFYLSLLDSSKAFAIALTAYSFFTLLLIIMLFYLPLLLVTYELRYRDMFKNALYLSFKKIGSGLLAFLMAGALIGGGLAAVIFTRDAARIVIIVLYVALVPMISTYMIVSVISKGMQEVVGSFVKAEPEPGAAAESPEELAALEQNINNSEDDYIFINGRMIKNPNKKGEESK